MEKLEKEQNDVIQNTREGSAKYLIIVVAAAIIIAVPVLYAGFPVDGHDSPAQFNFYKSFSHQVWMGELYPRWLLDMNDGFGSPAFFFYPPVSYYITTFFSLIFGQPTTNVQVWQQLGISTAVAIVASAITCYLWLKDMVGARPAAVASIIYLIIPYHLTVDLFTRGALAEVWAFVWMPLILKSVRNIRQKPILGLVGLAVSYALLIMTHIPTTLLFSAVPVAYSLFSDSGKDRKIRFILTALGMALGVGLADVYLLPALTARNYISLDPNPASPLFYAQNFLLPFSSEGYSPYILWLTVWLGMMVAGLVLCVISDKVSGLLKRERLFWLAAAVISIFMMIPLSTPVWQLISILQSVQFPYRFNTVLCLAFTAIMAIALSNVSFTGQILAGGWQKKLFIGGTAVLCCVWIGVLIDTVRQDKTEPAYKAYREKVYNLKLEFVESMPKTARMDLLDALIAERQKSGSPYFLRTDRPRTTVTVTQWKPRDITLNVAATEPTTLIVGQFYYPGWEAAIFPDSGQPPVELPVKPSDEGLLKIEAPAVSGQLRMALSSTGTEQSGLTTSLVSILALAVAALILSRYKQRFGLTENELSNG